MGIRSTALHGADGIANFEPIWECEDGSIGDGGDGVGSVNIIATDPNGASPGGGAGKFVSVVEGANGSAIDWDADYNLVLTINVEDVGYADSADAAGRFLWLLRASATAGTSWSVYFRDGYATARNYHDPVDVDGASWDYYEAATSTVPSRDAQAIAETSLYHSQTIHVFAKRTVGAGDLYLDCICPIPTDEGFAKLWDIWLTDEYECVIGEGPHEHTQVISLIDGATDYAIDVDPYEFENFRLPPGDGRIIAVYADITSSTLADQIEFANPSAVASSYTERWTALRGVE